MVRLVADSSALILLAKSGLLEIVCEVYEVMAPSAVGAEVANEALIRRHPDAALISELIKKGALKIETVGTPESSLPVSLHRGEKDALCLAKERPGSRFATDDGKAIKAARFLRVPFIITPRIVVELFRLERLSFTKARGVLEKLSTIGRYSPEIIAEALVSLLEERNGKTDDGQNT